MSSPSVLPFPESSLPPRRSQRPPAAQARPEPSGSAWRGIGIGLALLAHLSAVLLVFRLSHEPKPAPKPPVVSFIDLHAVPPSPPKPKPPAPVAPPPKAPIRPQPQPSTTRPESVAPQQSTTRSERVSPQASRSPVPLPKAAPQTVPVEPDYLPQ